MKKRISGILALGMALTLTFGMTAFAAEVKNPSPVTDEAEVIEIPGGVKADLTEPTGAEKTAAEAQQKKLEGSVTPEKKPGKVGKEDVEVTIEAITDLAVVKSADAAAATFAKTFEKEDNDKKVTATVEVVAGANIEVPKDTVVDTKNPLVTSVSLPGFTVKSNVTYVVLHLRSDGIWESVQASLSDGQAVVTLTSLSPIVVTEVVTKEEEKPAPTTKPADPTPAPAVPSNPPTSPETGETFPVAGFVALICVAGAAVSALMFRRNRKNA